MDELFRASLKIEPYQVECAYCGEQFEVMIDCSIEQQSYIEDCAVCCQAMQFSVSIEPNIEPSAQDSVKIQVQIKSLEE